MKKTIALVLTLVLIFALACPSAFAADKGSVYWLNFKPELDEAAQALAAKYTEQTGVPVKVVTAASGSYSQTLTSEMDKTRAPRPPSSSSATRPASRSGASLPWI